jgi:hypothetical protein
VATKSFAINTEPHLADVGGTVLKFQPEVIGADFAQAYAELRTVQAKVKGNKASSTKHAKEENLDPAVLVEVHEAMRAFIRRFLLEESYVAFDALRLPDRVLVQLLEWTAELYGGGSGNARGGSSSES